jgi:hypothetical protein
MSCCYIIAQDCYCMSFIIFHYYGIKTHHDVEDEVEEVEEEDDE